MAHRKFRFPGHMQSRHNYLYLLAGLLMVVIISPIARQADSQAGSLIIAATFSLTLILGIWSLVTVRIWFHLGIVLAVAGSALQLAGLYFESRFFRMAFFGIFEIFCAMTIAFAFTDVLFRGTVNLNKITGAICIYLLLAMFWAGAYILLEAFLPGSFEGLGTSFDDLHSSDLTYFSFVTITTLGYGDLTPLSDFARMLATLEALIGQLYLAILVAGLVGVHISNERFKRSD
jgi:voltage-gated potassium channel